MIPITFSKGLEPVLIISFILLLRNGQICLLIVPPYTSFPFLKLSCDNVGIGVENNVGQNEEVWN